MKLFRKFEWDGFSLGSNFLPDICSPVLNGWEKVESIKTGDEHLIFFQNVLSFFFNKNSLIEQFQDFWKTKFRLLIFWDTLYTYLSCYEKLHLLFITMTGGISIHYVRKGMKQSLRKMYEFHICTLVHFCKISSGKTLRLFCSIWHENS